MDFFDILLAKKLKNDKDVSIVQLNVSKNGTYSESGKAYSPVVVDIQPPSNSYLRTPIDSYPTTAEQLPIPKCDVEIANQKSCKVFVSNKPFVNDKVPYLFRKSAGGDRVYEKLIGGTIAWNQLVQNGNFADTSGWGSLNGTMSVSNNILTITRPSGSSASNEGVYHTGMKYVSGHKYIAMCDMKASATLTNYKYFSIANTQFEMQGGSLSTSWNKFYAVASLASVVNAYFNVVVGNLSSYTSELVLDIKNCMLIDLTQMFGTTIADYIYSLEQATAGAGVAWFRQMFPNDYYAYDSGSLQSVNVASKKVVGFNQWDEEWETGSLNDATGQPIVSTLTIRSKNYIRILPNTTYFIQAPLAGVACFYDSNKTFISSQTISSASTWTTPSNAMWMKFRMAGSYGATYNNDICINISNPAKNGTYEPYEEHTYTFDSDVTLRGIPKLDANNKLYYDGDVYESNGIVTRRYGIVDLGSLTWQYSNSNRFSSTLPLAVHWAPNVVADALCGKYVTVSRDNVANIDKSLSVHGADNSYLNIHDSAYSDVSTFTTAMSGVYLVYELATPTTETADPYTNPQIVDADGTEEFVDYAYSQSTRDVAVPVGHDSLYYNGQLYQTDFAQAITDTINMAELHSIIPPSGEFYITSNGTLSVDVWKK